MRVALVNPNRYRLPPVVPVGLEYLVGPLRGAGHEVTLCDLCFSESAHADLVSFLEEERPDVVGFTVRNMETTLFFNNTFFLDDIADLIAVAREVAGRPVVIGGAATLCAGMPLADYLGADHVVVGPGEVCLPRLLDGIASGDAPRLVDGRESGIPPGFVHRRGEALDYSPYLEGGDPVGLEFRKGCDWACPYCAERARPVLARDVGAVVREAGLLVDAGVGMFYSCDSEANLDLEGTGRMLRTLSDADLPLTWSGYFRPAPFNGELAALVARSGCTKLTVSATSWELSGEGGPYGAREMKAFLAACADSGITVAVDLLVGHPGETRASVVSALEILSGLRPATVGVGQYIRLYEDTPFTGIARADRGGELFGDPDDNPGMLKPVFYTALDREWLEETLKADPLFTIAGEQPGVNYQKT